jgi:hypothetical protein
MKTKQFITAAFETIDFQNKGVARNLELLISNFRSKDYDSKKSQTASDLFNIQLFILENFGLTTKITTNTSILAAVELPSVNMNHIFFDNFIKMFVEDEVKEFEKTLKDNSKGFINLKTSKVSGVFSKINIQLYLSWDKLFKNKSLTDSEVCAVVLHELGHAFTTFEYMLRTVRTNQAMAAVSNALLKKDHREYEIILKSTGKHLYGDEKKFDSIKEITNSAVAVNFIATTEIRDNFSELGTLFYDKSSCEYLADQFVNRHGYGLHLTSGLYKIHKEHFAPETNKYTSHIFHILNFVSSIIGFTAGALLIVSGSILTCFIGALGILGIITSNKLTETDFEYDKLKIRLTRSKEQLIAELKQNNLPIESIKQKIKDIEEVGAIIDKVFDKTPILTSLLIFLLPSQRKANKAMELQRKLEELASNDLFVKAAKLKTMTI